MKTEKLPEQSQHFNLNIFHTETSRKYKYFYILNIPVAKIKKFQNYEKFLLFSCLPLYYKYDDIKDFRYKFINTILDIFLPNKTRRKILDKFRVSVSLPIDENKFTQLQFDNEPILQELKKLGEFTYMPNPGNMGDCLIAKATYDFFDDNKLPYTIYNGKAPKHFVYGGGGIWVYRKACRNILKIMTKAEKIIILPSSFWDCDELISSLDERFTIFCREKKSYDYLVAHKTKAKIILDHDMALRLTSKHFKNDKIKVNVEQAHVIKKIRQKLQNTRNVIAFLRNDAEKDNTYQTDFDLSLVYNTFTMTKEEVDFAGRLMLSTIARYDKIITDRLHVGIASVLMGREVFWLDNNYKKISEVYKNSLNHQTNVHFCQEYPNEFKRDKK